MGAYGTAPPGQGRLVLGHELLEHGGIGTRGWRGRARRSRRWDRAPA